MDFLTNKELNKFKGEVKASMAAVEAEKFSFEKKLHEGLGENMLNELKDPTNPNWWYGIKLKFARWRQKHREMKEYRKLMKELDEINNDMKEEMGGF